MENLSLIELEQVNGGGFAYDVGRVLRFAWINATEGPAAALLDWAINDVKCGC